MQIMDSSWAHADFGSLHTRDDQVKDFSTQVKIETSSHQIFFYS